MELKTLRTVGVAIFFGLVFFAVIMGMAIGIVILNSRLSPGIPWFPLPISILLIAAMWGAEKRWGIGLQTPTDVPWGKVYAAGIALTVVGVAACAVQGYFTGYVRESEPFDPELSRAFNRTYAIFLSVLAATLAEASFRGVMQTRMQTVLSVWPVVIIIGIVNVLAHRWGPEITQNWFGIFVVLAGWTYLRWLSKSLWPPLVMHTVTNLIVATWVWNQGAIIHADMTQGATVVVAIVGVAGLLLAAMLARNWHRTSTAMA